MDKLKIVKLIVFLLTFLLIFGIIVAGGTIYKKVSRKTPDTSITLNQPKGSYIADYKINEDSLYILIKGGKKEDRILIVSTISPAKQTTISLAKEN